MYMNHWRSEEANTSPQTGVTGSMNFMLETKTRFSAGEVLLITHTSSWSFVFNVLKYIANFFYDHDIVDQLQLYILPTTLYFFFPA